MMIREPIISVLGHVDHGKTTFLDKIRGTTLAEREAGRITQHIGATEVPIETVKELSGELIKRFGFQLNIPGLLFIDTPGHAAFTNLRKRGGSIADLAVLVVDITQGFQEQTVEAIEILRSYKTPFIVATTKIDKLREWNSREGSFIANLKRQGAQAEQELNEKIYAIVASLFKHGFESERVDLCADFTKQVPIVPVSSVSGEGIPEILVLLAGLSQKFLKKELEVLESEEMKGTVLEVKEEKGFGTTVDLILYSGTLHTGSEIVLGGKNGIIKTKVRALLKPMPLEEMRDTKKKFLKVKEAVAACGVKVAAPGLDEALAGSPVRVPSEKKDVESEILKEIDSIKVKGTSGIVIKADTLGSLEALTRVFSEKNIPIKKGDLGSITKHDILEAHSVKTKNPLHGVVIGFNVETEHHATEEAKRLGVKIFSEKVIYSLIEAYLKFVEEETQKARAEKEKKLAFPAKFVFLKGFVFRRSDPAIFGVKILAGKLKPNARIMDSCGREIGKVECLQCNGKNLQEAREGQEIALSLSGGIIGRNLKEGDILFTIIPENSFGELLSLDLSESECTLLEEIKKIWQKEAKEAVE
ncbi:MAG: translation initiation factor IF-2 [Candidatus Diapherotrites archaeon]